MSQQDQDSIARVEHDGGSDPGAPPAVGSVGVVIGIPEPMASELRGWRASFGDPLAAVIPPHITLVTTTPVHDWDEATEHVRSVAREQAPFTAGHVRHGQLPAGLARGLPGRQGRIRRLR